MMDQSQAAPQQATSSMMTAASAGVNTAPTNDTSAAASQPGQSYRSEPTDRELREKGYVPQARPKTPIKEDEIRITSEGRLPRYVTYAARLFSEQGKESVIIKATGNAIGPAITLAEIVKRRFPNLYQLNKIGSTRVQTVYDPPEQGLKQEVTQREVPFLDIILTKTEAALDKKDPGYQEPIDQSLVRQLTVEQIAAYRPERRYNPRVGYRGGRGGFRGRGRGMRGGGMNYVATNVMAPGQMMQGQVPMMADYPAGAAAAPMERPLVTGYVPANAYVSGGPRSAYQTRAYPRTRGMPRGRGGRGGGMPQHQTLYTAVNDETAAHIAPIH